jgi:hypothetical protein
VPRLWIGFGRSASIEAYATESYSTSSLGDYEMGARWKRAYPGSSISFRDFTKWGTLEACVPRVFDFIPGDYEMGHAGSVRTQVRNSNSTDIRRTKCKLAKDL